MKYEIKELKFPPTFLSELVLCHAVRTDPTKQKAIEKLEDKIGGKLDCRPVKFDKNREYICYVYEVEEVGYEAILISLPKNVEPELFDEYIRVED